MFVVIVLFLVGLICLIKGGDWFVDGATGIAEKFHLPEILIGATIVSIGTTLPEMMVSAQAALAGNGGISYGNAIGSVICNTSLIAAITIAVRYRSDVTT
jgi:cation:H+ antiporter